MSFPQPIIDLALRIADEAGIPQAHFMGVLQVESAGQPFETADPSFPTLREEPFRAWNNLPVAKRDAARAAGLAVSRKKDVSYQNQRTSQDRVEVFRALATIDEDAAYRSCSWGLGQVLGSNAVSIGYASAKAMFLDFQSGPEAQITAIVQYCRVNGCLDALINGEWEDFAEVYNGPDWRTWNYAPRIASAVAQWHVRLTSGQTQTPADPAVLTLGSTGEAVRVLQQRLTDLGYPVRVDGSFGVKTHAAVFAFQGQHALPPDGMVGPQTQAILAASAPVPQGARELATTKTVAQTNQAAAGASWIKRAAKVFGVGTVVDKALGDPLGNLSSLSDKVTSAQSSVSQISTAWDTASATGLVPSSGTVLASAKAVAMAVGSTAGAPEVLAVVAACAVVYGAAHFLILKPAVEAEKAGATV